jgi:hypothetical protein
MREPNPATTPPVTSWQQLTDYLKEHGMTDKSTGAWLTLNSTYFANHTDNPLSLLSDADTLLKRANAVAATMRELLFINPNANRQELMFSLQAVETLMQMAQGSTREAQMRFEEIGDGWLTGDYE